MLTLALLVAAALGGRALALRAWAGRHYRAASRAVEEHDLDGAREHLRRCLRARPADPEALLLAGRTARRAGAFDEAEEYLDALEALRGPGPRISLERVLARVQRGDLTDEPALRSLVGQNHPETPLILEALAHGYEATAQAPSLHEALRLLLDRWPDHPQGRLLRGRGRDLVGRHEEALEDYQKAAGVAPRWADARLALAEALRRLGRPAEAAAAYEATLRLRPGDQVAPVGLAECRYDLGEPDEALRVLEALLADHPDHVAGLAERGRLLVRARRAAEAEPGLRRAAALAPGSRGVQRVLLLCLEAQGKDGDAREARRRLDRIDARLTRVLKLKHQLQEDSPHDPRLFHEIGTLLLGLQQEDEGLRFLAGALRIDPYFAPAHLALAEHLERAGRAGEARAHRDAARRSHPR